MTNTLLDFSLRSELALHTRVVADVEAAAATMGIAPLIVGAFARDLHLLYRCGVKMQRQTEDIDFALAVPDWSAFGALRERLIDGGAFRAQGSAAHRLWHTSGLPVDLVPFGGVETDERKIAWPPRGEFAMDVFGFREALATAHPVLLPGQVHTRLVSLPALTVLKIMCWQYRHYQSPRKDAHDLQMILRHYLAADNESRLYGDFVDWTQSDDFDYELAGPRMLGYDIRQLLDATGQKQVARLLQQQIDPAQPGRLPNEMNASEPDRALAWLNALMRGLLHT